MGSLIRATTLWGYGELVQQLGGDPDLFVKRFGIPPGIENQLDASSSPLMHTCACWRPAPTTSLRRSRTSPVALAGPGHPRTHRGDRPERANLARRVETRSGATFTSIHRR